MSASLSPVRRLLADLEGKEIAIGGRRGARLLSLAHHIAFGREVSDAAIIEVLSAGREVARSPVLVPTDKGRAIAIVPCYGVCTPKLTLPPFAFSTFALADTITELSRDSSIAGVCLDIDSPGGLVTGTIECADAIFAARKMKPIAAFTSGLMASAAYWLGSQATAGSLIATKSAEVGSIGVFLVHENWADFNKRLGVEITYIADGKYKTEGHLNAPLSPESRDSLQGEIARTGDLFRKAVARGRNTTVADVAKNFGQGRIVTAPDAARNGMIDRVGSFDDVMRVASIPSSRRAATSLV